MLNFMDFKLANKDLTWNLMVYSSIADYSNFAPFIKAKVLESSTIFTLFFEGSNVESAKAKSIASILN